MNRPSIRTSEPAHRLPMSPWQRERERGVLHPMYEPEPLWRSALAVASIAAFTVLAIFAWGVL